MKRLYPTGAFLACHPVLQDKVVTVDIMFSVRQTFFSSSDILNGQSRIEYFSLLSSLQSPDREQILMKYFISKLEICKVNSG